MLKRFLFSLCILPMFLFVNLATPVFADDLSEGLQLYRAKKYQEAIPLLERAANDGHEKAIEALDQIYAKQPKVPETAVTPLNKKEASADKSASNTANDNSSATSDSDENAKSNFRRKVIAIAIAIGIIAAWFIHRKILKKRKAQQQNQKPPM